MSILTHSAETLMPHSWLPIAWTCTSTRSRSSLLLASLGSPFQWGWEASVKHELQRLWCCWHEAHMSPCCVACVRLSPRSITTGCTVLLPTRALRCADQAQRRATAPLLKEKVSSMESQPKPKHAGWRQSQGNWGGWEMQTSVPRFTAIEIAAEK